MFSVTIIFGVVCTCACLLRVIIDARTSQDIGVRETLWRE